MLTFVIRIIALALSDRLQVLAQDGLNRSDLVVQCRLVSVSLPV